MSGETPVRTYPIPRPIHPISTTVHLEGWGRVNIYIDDYYFFIGPLYFYHHTESLCQILSKSKFSPSEKEQIMLAFIEAIKEKREELERDFDKLIRFFTFLTLIFEKHHFQPLPSSSPPPVDIPNPCDIPYLGEFYKELYSFVRYEESLDRFLRDSGFYLPELNENSPRISIIIPFEAKRRGLITLFFPVVYKVGLWDEGMDDHLADKVEVRVDGSRLLLIPIDGGEEVTRVYIGGKTSCRRLLIFLQLYADMKEKGIDVLELVGKELRKHDSGYPNNEKTIEMYAHFKSVLEGIVELARQLGLI